MRKVRSWTIYLLVLLMIWQILSVFVNNALICPSPLLVLQNMKEQLLSASFFPYLGSTLARALTALVLSFLSGLLFAFAAFLQPKISFGLEKTVVLMQAVPNIAYIILLLFWAGRNEAIILVQFFLLFPLVCRSFMEGFADIRQKWNDIFTLYPQPVPVLLKDACLPMLRPVFSASLKSASSLALKAGVMAEILASARSGMGRGMQIARMSVNPAGVLGWVIWLLLLAFACEKLCSLLVSFLFHES